MARTPQDITDAELAVLQVLWEQGPATIRRITELLYPQGGTSHYATVQKLLERLETKACVRRDRSNSPLQPLTLMNDTVFVECAQALGQLDC